MDRKSDKLGEVQIKVKEITQVMNSNLEKAVLRGEDIDRLHDKSISLLENSEKFELSSRQVKRQQQMKRLKMILCVTLLISISVGIIIIFSIRSN